MILSQDLHRFALSGLGLLMRFILVLLKMSFFFQVKILGITVIIFFFFYTIDLFLHCFIVFR